MESLPTDEVHVWLEELPEKPSLEALDAADALLSSAERARADRFRFDRQRHIYRLSHALVRHTLSRYAPLDAAAWEFEVEEGGRPRIAGPEQAPLLRFNLSHTDGFAACAVAVETDVGVDVEAAARVRQPCEIAERNFAREESAAISARSGEEQIACFLEHWTLKEAYLKARGDGLAVPLDRMRFALPPSRTPGSRFEGSGFEGAEGEGLGGSAVAVAFDPELADDPADWQFALIEPAPRLRLAVAVHRPGRRDLGVRLHWREP